MPTDEKRAAIDELVESIKRSSAVFLVEYRGLTVAKSTDIRRKIRKTDGEMKVTKNTLMRIALREAGQPTADVIDTGPNAYVMAYGDIAATAKALRDFSKEKGNEALVIKGGIMGGEVLTKDQVIALADLPPRDVLIAQVVGTMAAPIRSLLTVLSGPARGFVTCLAQIQEQKEKAA